MASCKFIRTFAKGLIDQARVIATATGLSEQEAYQSIIRYGLESNHDQAHTQAAKQAFTTVFNEISIHITVIHQPN